MQENVSKNFHKAEGFYFSTINLISVHDSRKELLKDVFSICERFEKLLSKTIAGSDVWRIGHANGQWVEVDNHTAVLIKAAFKYSRISKGLFDISVAPACSLWNLKDGSIDFPSDKMLSSALARIGYEQIEQEGNFVRVTPGVELDLGGIAKGYIADRIAEYLRIQGVESAIIDLGGNIYALGQKYGKRPWNVGIRDPYGSRESYMAVVSVSDKSVVTSGIYERSVKKGNMLFHHILHPKTGLPVQNELCAVTVISERSIDADALSTMCFLLGMYKGLELIESLPGTEAIFVTKERKIIGTSGIGSKILCKFIDGQI